MGPGAAAAAAGSHSRGQRRQPAARARQGSAQVSRKTSHCCIHQAAVRLLPLVALGRAAELAVCFLAFTAALPSPSSCLLQPSTQGRGLRARLVACDGWAAGQRRLRKGHPCLGAARCRLRSVSTLQARHMPCPVGRVHAQLLPLVRCGGWSTNFSLSRAPRHLQGAHSQRGGHPVEPHRSHGALHL